MYLLLFVLILNQEITDAANTGKVFQTVEECRKEGQGILAAKPVKNVAFLCQPQDGRKFI